MASDAQAAPSAPRASGSETKNLFFTKVPKSAYEQTLIGIFVFLPLLALLAAIPLAVVYGWVSWRDFVIAGVFFLWTRTGIGVSFHRLETHGSFKAKRFLRILLGIAGSMGMEGPLLRWVADHRRHHKFSDIEGDPHSPWRFGRSGWNLFRGFLYSHVGWLFDDEKTNVEHFTSESYRNGDAKWLSELFWLWMILSLALPPLIGGLWGAGFTGWSWHAAWTALIWGTGVRMSLMHHITWSINSVCHTMGERPYLPATNKLDMASNVRWLADASGGESWHNLHHADPTCYRHGPPGERDFNAAVIEFCARLGWATDLRKQVMSKYRPREEQAA